MAYEFKLPDIGEGVVEGEIVTWLVSPGDEVAEDQPMVEVMTDKATVEIPSPVAGRIVECRGGEGDVIDVGSVLVVIQPAGEGGAEPQKAAAEEAATEAEPSSEPDDAVEEELREVPVPSPAPRRSSEGSRRASGRGESVKATPAVRRLAREQGVDLTAIEGSGKGGRITSEDVAAASGRKAAPPKPARPAEVAGPAESIPYRGLRRRIGEQLSESKRTAPHFTYVEEVDVTELVELRRRFNKAHPDQKVTYLPFIMKAVVSGLQEYPVVNSTLDEEKGEIRLLKFYNLGIATATAAGLFVPVLKHVDEKTIVQLSAELAALSEATREGRASLEDLQGSTFTITSLGALGGLLATPIINYPEVAILGVHKIASRPVVYDGEVAIREIMNLSISLDHRVVDGHVGAAFLQHVVRLLQDPGLLLIG